MPETIAWPADQVERRSVASLTPYARNARTHSGEQINQIVASIREWGWTNPILIDEDGTIIAGHGRVLAAEQMGLVEVPAMVARGWTDAQKRAYVIADNKLAENAGWDEALLKSEFGAITNAGFDLSLIGFAEVDISRIMAKGSGRTDPDEVPPAPVRPTARLGDTWLMGKHRLRCGNSESPMDVTMLLAGEIPHLMVTDPPYGVSYDPTWRKQFGAEGLASGAVMNDDRADWRAAWRLFPGHVAYVWHGALHNVAVSESLRSAGFLPRAQIIWVKTRAPISRGHYHWQHEPAYYAERVEPAEVIEHEGWAVDHFGVDYVVRPGQSARWRGGRKQTTVWFIEQPKNDTGHGTQKPVECMRRPILNNSGAGDAVYEPFSGSGTTLIACEMEARRAYAMELDPRYIDVTIKRWQDFTGRSAILDGDGRPFDVIASERAAAAEVAQQGEPADQQEGPDGGAEVDERAGARGADGPRRQHNRRVPKARNIGQDVS